MVKCKLCGGAIACKAAGKDARACAAKTAVPPRQCWLEDENSLKALCAQSLSPMPVKGFNERAAAFSAVGEVIDKSDLHLRSVIAKLSELERFELMHHAVPALKVKLSPLLVELEVDKLQPPEREVSIPDDISEQLRTGLVEYLDRLRRRLETVRKRGGTRRPPYLQNLLSIPIRLARFLDAAGIRSWDAMRKRDVVAFLAANPKVTPTQLSRLLRALSEDKPFAERRGRYVRGRGASKAVPLQEVMTPQAVDDYLSAVKDRCTTPEYLGAWLVAKMGMSAAAVHRLTADRLKVDPEGRVVIRPAEAWVVLPKAIGRQIGEIADLSAPGWRESKGNEFAHVRVFHKTLPKLDRFRDRVLGRDAWRLRASAVYAALLSGHLDRVTLHLTMGVSHATIASIERHLSADIHRKLDPALVRARNKVLTGDE